MKYQSGQIDDALLDFQRFVRNSQNVDLLPDAYYYLGAIFTERNKPKEAEAYFRQIISRHPSSSRVSEARQLLGDLLLEQNESQEALQVFQTLEASQPNDRSVLAKARYGQAQALLQLNRLQQAEQLLEELTESSFTTAQRGPINLGLARVYESDNRFSEALTLYRDVVNTSRDGTGAEALYRLGNLLILRGQNREAIEELGRMNVLFSGFPDWVARGYILQAQAFINLGQRGEAIQLYDRVIEEFSGTVFATQASDSKASL